MLVANFESQITEQKSKPLEASRSNWDPALLAELDSPGFLGLEQLIIVLRSQEQIEREVHRLAILAGESSYFAYVCHPNAPIVWLRNIGNAHWEGLPSSGLRGYTYGWQVVGSGQF